MSRRSLLALAAALVLIALLALLVPRRERGGGTAPEAAGPAPAAGEEGANPAPPAPAALETGPGRETLGSGVAEVPDDGILLEVRTEDGEPLPGASVTLVKVEPFHELGLTRDAVLASGLEAGPDGRHLFRDLVPGERYRAAATAPGFRVERSPAAAPGERIELRLGPSLVVSGTVVREGGGPVAEAEVQLLALQTRSFLTPQVARTGADGGFLFEVSEPGLYRLQVTSAAGQDVTRDFEVGPDLEPLRIVVGGEPSLTLRALDDGGGPVAGALVELAPLARGRKARRGRTDAAGELSFYSLPAGYWTLVIRAEGLAVHQERWLYRGSGHEVLERTLGRPGTLAVRVRDTAGRIVPGLAVQIRLRQAGAPPLPAATTDEEGVARWTELPAGDYLVLVPGGGRGPADGIHEEQALAGGRAPSTAWAAVRAGDESTVDLVLNGHARANVRVLAEGRPVAGAVVSLVRGAAGVGGRRQPPAARGRTDARGEVLLAPVSPGPWRLQVEPGEGRAPVEVPVELAPGTPEETVELPAGVLAGRVADAGGPVAGALLRLLDARGPTGWQGVRSGADGRFEIGAVGAGRWRLEVRAPGHLPWTSPELEHDGRSRLDLGEIRLALAGSLEGTVSGLPLPSPGTLSIRVAELLDAGGAVVATSPVDSSGGYRFPEVPPGSYVLVVRSADREWRAPVEIGRGSQRFDFPVDGESGGGH